MKSVVQLVSQATVSRSGNSDSRRLIKTGLVVYLGISKLDTETQVRQMVDKIMKLRIFPDKDSKMNLSVTDAGAEIMLISQFTLFGDLKGNNRPSFSGAAGKEEASRFFELAAKFFTESGVRVVSGYFGELMEIEQVNQGPVTIIIDTDNL